MGLFAAAIKRFDKRLKKAKHIYVSNLSDQTRGGWGMTDRQFILFMGIVAVVYCACGSADPATKNDVHGTHMPILAQSPDQAESLTSFIEMAEAAPRIIRRKRDTSLR